MPTQQRLSEVFVELADTLVADFDVVEFLTTLADRSAELLHATEAGVVLADESGALRSVASSSEAATSVVACIPSSHVSIGFPAACRCCTSSAAKPKPNSGAA